MKSANLIMCAMLALAGCSQHGKDRESWSAEVEECVNTEMKSQEEVKISESGEVTFSAAQLKGMKLFMKHCNKCHPGGEKGKGPSLNDKALPNFLIHWQVRLGIGDMPQFKKDEISKEEVKQIISFVRLLRETHREK